MIHLGSTSSNRWCEVFNLSYACTWSWGCDSQLMETYSHWLLRVAAHRSAITSANLPGSRDSSSVPMKPLLSISRYCNVEPLATNMGASVSTAQTSLHCIHHAEVLDPAANGLLKCENNFREWGPPIHSQPLECHSVLWRDSVKIAPPYSKVELVRKQAKNVMKTIFHLLMKFCFGWIVLITSLIGSCWLL